MLYIIKSIKVILREKNERQNTYLLKLLESHDYYKRNFKHAQNTNYFLKVIQTSQS